MMGIHHHILGARVPGRVGEGVERTRGGDACVALGGGATQPPLVVEPNDEQTLTTLLPDSYA
jgi:hypothetical protein